MSWYPQEVPPWRRAGLVGEIQAGIERTRERDPAKAGAIERWLDQIGNTFNILARVRSRHRSALRLPGRGRYGSRAMKRLPLPNRFMA